MNTCPYSKAKAEAKVKAVWRDIADDVTKDLGLNQVPVLAFDSEDKVMFINYINFYKQIGVNKKIINQKTDYIIHVNSQAISDAINALNMATFKDLSEQLIKALLRHECRHLYQFQNEIDKNTLNFETSDEDEYEFSGYGADKKETDANVYAINAAQNKTEHLVATYFKILQDEACKLFPDYTESNVYINYLRSH